MAKLNAGDQVDDSILIAVMGATGSGKSTFINLASGSNLRISEGLESCTRAVEVTQAFKLDDRQVVLIDTPGFDDTNRSDTDILETIATFLGTSYKNGDRLSGVIYIHRISDFRVGGSSSRNFKLFCNLCGDKALENGVIITNMWGEVELSKGETREAELKDKFFTLALEKGAKMFRHDNTEETAHNILRSVFPNRPLPLQLQTELVDEKKTLLVTVTGAELNREVLEATQKHEAEIKKLQEEMEEAMRMKDEEARKELEEAKRELQRKVDQMKHDAERLKSVHLKRQNVTSLDLVGVGPEATKKALSVSHLPRNQGDRSDNRGFRPKADKKSSGVEHLMLVSSNLQTDPSLDHHVEKRPEAAKVSQKNDLKDDLMPVQLEQQNDVSNAGRRNAKQSDVLWSDSNPEGSRIFPAYERPSHPTTQSAKSSGADRGGAGWSGKAPSRPIHSGGNAGQVKAREEVEAEDCVKEKWHGIQDDQQKLRQQIEELELEKENKTLFFSAKPNDVVWSDSHPEGSRIFPAYERPSHPTTRSAKSSGADQGGASWSGETPPQPIYSSGGNAGQVTAHEEMKAEDCEKEGMWHGIQDDQQKLRQQIEELELEKENKTIFFNKVKESASGWVETVKKTKFTVSSEL